MAEAMCPLYDEMPQAWCSHCQGRLRQRPYRQVLENLGFLKVEEPKVRECELCKRRKPVKGNRVYVRVPRPKRSWGQAPLPFPPTFLGPTVEAPRIYKATHRTDKGRWACDRCDSKGRQPVKQVKQSREVADAQRIFGL